MKVILYMATTVNGFIAKEKDDTSFVSSKSWKNYLNMVRKADTVIIGRRTYEIMPREEFQRGCLYIVLTHKKSLKKKVPNIIFTAGGPKRVLTLLKTKGYKYVCICGGGKLNALFMKAGLVDEIYLDVEPIVFSKGVRLFAENDFEVKLKLIGVKKFSPNELQLHYKVVK